jgi:hypothetical protein
MKGANDITIPDFFGIDGAAQMQSHNNMPFSL